MRDSVVGQVGILDVRRLDGTSDSIVLRDARGRGARPALAVLKASNSADFTARAPRLQVRGPFSVLQRFAVRPAQGHLFAGATRDDNPIHVDGDVVPGAMTSARLLLLPELLLPGFVAERLRVKFSAPSRYDVSTVHQFRFIPVFDATRNDTLVGMEISFNASQNGQTVASGSFRGSVGAPARENAENAVAPPAEVEAFLRSLDVDGDAYLRHAGDAYPRAFLASLPSGEMVRQLRGEGGLLNVLNLSFTEGDGIPLRGGDRPEVEIERSLRPGSSFSKVLTRVVQGVRTYCQGFAMVFLAPE
jgi:acyl dehydratase